MHARASCACVCRCLQVVHRSAALCSAACVCMQSGSKIHHSPGCSLSRCVDHQRGQVLIFTEMCQGSRVQLTRHGSKHAAMITVVSRPLPVMTVTTRLAPSASMVA